jgi:hypothetical protein
VQQHSNLYIYATEANQRIVEDDQHINQLEHKVLPLIQAYRRFHEINMAIVKHLI